MFKFENGKTPINDSNLNAMQVQLLETIFPIGSTYITQEDINPSTILEFGTWERIKGKVAIGLDEDDTDFNTIGNSGGEKEVTLTIEKIPPHSHTMPATIGTGSNLEGVALGNSKTPEYDSYNSSDVGAGQPHNNMPPYEVVGYMWIRRS